MDQLYNPEIHHRRTTRLPAYDYSRAGAYFVTICTRDREYLFGEVMNGDMVLNQAGDIVSDEWLHMRVVRPDVWLDYFVVMPNHFHAIVVLTRSAIVGATRRVARTNEMPHRIARANGPVSGSIGAIIGQFKSVTTKRINQMRAAPGVPVWQRNYYERVIRDAAEMGRMREYIATNPAHWREDENYLA